MSDPVSNFLDGVQKRVQPDDDPPGIAYGPCWAKQKGAEEPPEDLQAPVWAPDHGWMEKGEVEPTDGRPGTFLLLYSPTDMGQ